MAVVVKTGRQGETRVDWNPQLRKHAAAFGVRKCTTARVKNIFWDKLNLHSE